ncbi:MAG: hypothetical protein CL868_08780 [Cytophagaceae bacterium]|nr:hypothetical protein [Cytophagaceae bacterium]|tara:strand:+ start:7680 stop:7916 length:237 start_codon:yes stop_codon:yes gene_type:complete
MPTVLRINGYRFFFYSNEHLPVHVHIEKANMTAKFNLEPVTLVISRRFKASKIAEIRNLVNENAEFLIQKWHEYFNNK